MNLYKNLIEKLNEIEARLGYVFRNKQLLILALIHRSYVNEHRDQVEEHNERLEFLGDTVLGLLIADYLYSHYPDLPEGELSYLRSRLVEAQSCVQYIQQLNIDSYLLLGKGERLNDGRGRETILSDLFEAIIGAIYLDGGLEAARSFLIIHFERTILGKIATPERNWKAILQDYSQKYLQAHPVYLVEKESGPDHSKQFQISVSLGGEVLGRGEGSSKKSAQQMAAKEAVEKLSIEFPSEP